VAGVVRHPDIADPFNPRVRPGVNHRVIKNAIDGGGGAYSGRGLASGTSHHRLLPVRDKTMRKG
jgi:hypothetical protein